MKKLILIALCLCLGAPMAANAQTKVKDEGNYIKVKHKVPKYTKAVSPGSNYNYIKEDWTWNPTTRDWDWNGNRWEVAPEPSKTWVSGHWKNDVNGWTWVEGHWK